MKPQPVSKEIEEKILKTLRYDKKTGRLLWKASAAYRIKPGDLAGTQGSNTTYGYVMVGNRSLLAHRVAWFLYHGAWPAEYLDHIDGNKFNNLMSNLRECTKAQNSANRAANKRSRVPFVNIGKRLEPQYVRKPYYVHIYRAGTEHFKGYFATVEEAVKARDAMRTKLDGKFSIHLSRRE